MCQERPQQLYETVAGTSMSHRLAVSAHVLIRQDGLHPTENVAVGVMRSNLTGVIRLYPFTDIQSKKSPANEERENPWQSADLTLHVDLPIEAPHALQQRLQILSAEGLEQLLGETPAVGVRHV
jgi:hypothetical protein